MHTPRLSRRPITALPQVMPVRNTIRPSPVSSALSTIAPRVVPVSQSTRASAPRRGLRADIRRCTAVAHRRSVERIGGIQFRHDIAVGRAPVVERPGIDREFREDRGFGRGRNIGIRGRYRKPCLVVGCRIPSLEAVSGFGYGSQRAPLFMAQDDPVVRQGRSFSVIQRAPATVTVPFPFSAVAG